MAQPVPRLPLRPQGISDEGWEFRRQRYRRDLQKHWDNLPAWAKSKGSGWYLFFIFFSLAVLMASFIWYAQSLVNNG